MQKEIITAEYNGHKIIADIMPAGSVPQIFCMHGGGGSSKKRYEQIRQLLAHNNISSYALDFFGHGETGGNIEESSLKSRTEQAEVIIEKAKALKPLNIIASSMSAYTAIKLTEIYSVTLLVLVVPAVYGKSLYEVSFGDQFSGLIREEGSWDKTDAWTILNQYKGNLLIISAGKDEVIPAEVIKKVYNSATNAKYKEIINFPTAPHKILGAYFNEHTEDLKIVADKIIKLLK